MVHRPEWFTDGKIFISYADTVGINKDGNTLFAVNQETGLRTSTVDDLVARDVEALLVGNTTETSQWVGESDASVGAPKYYDRRFSDALSKFIERTELRGMEARTIGSLVEEGQILSRPGHGSPPQDLRLGLVPYIKVSDIRAGQVNINPTNRVSRVVAEKFWRSDDSGLEAFDLISPIRASKNIGEFAVLMPGQERIVLTKEMLVLRVSEMAEIDNFYLLWALSLKVVRDQWSRIVLMQTNREDVGKRYLEIEIPWPVDAGVGREVSEPFRAYYVGLAKLRRTFNEALREGGDHHVFLGDVDVQE